MNTHSGETIVLIKAEDVHAKHKQERSSSKGQVGGELPERKEHAKNRLLRVCQKTNHLENDGDLWVVTGQSARFGRQT